MSLRILTETDLKNILTMQDAIKVMKNAFFELASENVYQPLRTAIPIPKHDAVTLCMPAYSANTEELGIKIVSVFPHNSQLKLPTIHGLIFLLNANTGQPEALLDGTFLTALRTGAVSGLATDLLARADASSVAIIGAGVQAYTQLEAICCVRKIKKIWLYSRDILNSERFAKKVQANKAISAQITITHSAREATKKADIICTATPATSPVIDLQDVPAGTHINAIGSHSEKMCEIGPALIKQAKIIVDLRAAALAEAGEIIQNILAGFIKEDELTELGTLTLNPEVGRTSAEQITLFKSVGLAIQDVSIAQYALNVAKKSNHQGKIINF